MSRTERALSAALFLAVTAFALHRTLVPMGETDLFFHLKLGDLIRAQHHVPFRNLFSFTYPDAPDQDLAWGFQVLVSWLYALGGWPAIVLCKVVCVTGAAMLVHRAARRSGADAVPSAIATVLAVCAADQRIVERPHLVTFVGLGVLANLLAEVRRGNERAAWWLPPLAFVWANLHAGVFLCGVVTVLHGIGARLNGRAWPKNIVLVLVLMAVATTLTPAGLGLPRYLAWHTGLGSTRIIEEFRVANAWSDPWFFVMLALCAGGAIVLRRQRLDEVLPVLVVAALAWRSVRFVAEWAFLATTLVALTLTAIGRVLEPSLWVKRAGAVLAMLAIVTTIVVERRGQPLDLGLADDVVPFRAIHFVSEHDLRDRMFEDIDVGCYLLWEGWPRYRVFQDARLPAYPDDFHRALDDLDPKHFQRLLERFDVDTALIDYPDINVRAGDFDPDEWALVFRDDDALVFAKRTTAHEDVIRAFEIPLRVRFALIGGSHVEPIRSPPARSPVPQGEWAKRLAVELYAEAHRR